MPALHTIAPIIWAKWGNTFLETLRQASLSVADGLAFEAMNSEWGVRTLLVVCTTDHALIQAIAQDLPLKAVVRPADWRVYSVAEMIFKTEKAGGFSYQEQRDGSGRTAFALGATRPAEVQKIERLCGLPE